MTSQCDGGGGGGGGGPVATASGWPAPPAARDGDVRAADDSYHAWTQATQATQGEIRNWACDVTLDAAGGRAARERADCDAIYRQLAVKNGQINRMTRQQLHDKLDELKLDSRGVKEALRKRLKAHYKRLRLARLQSACSAPGAAPGRAPRIPFVLVIDFEATCQRGDASYTHEIIEFPVVLVDVASCAVVAEFHSFVRPKINPILTEFCTQLTGITQADVDAAPDFSEVLSRVEAWREEHGLTPPCRTAVLTDGPWDMSRFMWLQCELLDIPMPDWCKRWINVRRAYANWYRCRRCRLTAMLAQLGLAFEGREHSGLDDARNIARVAVRMLRDGCTLRVNERMSVGRDGRPAVETVARRETTADDDDAAETCDALATDVAGMTLTDGGTEGDATTAAGGEEAGESGEVVGDCGEGDVADLLTYYALQKDR